MKNEIRLNDKDFYKAIEEKRKLFAVGGPIQQFIDSEVLRLMVPYTPMDTGAMIQSATAGTVIGSGKIEYNSPYARYLYYGEVYGPNIPVFKKGVFEGYRSPKHKNPTGRPLTYSTERHPLAGKLWFERMKADHKDDILKGAIAIAMGRNQQK